MNDRHLFKIVLIILALPVAIAAGCQERYRYPCQDPANWEKDICKKPMCEVHRNCPDLIFKEDSIAIGINPSQVTNVTRSCDKGCK
jgi:hypothetical protein